MQRYIFFCKYANLFAILDYFTYLCTLFMTNCMNIIFDLGGVLMMHNMPGCIQKFTRLMGEKNMQQVLGLNPNGEGSADSLMEKFECGLVSEQEFISTLLPASRPGTTESDIIDAWVTMHAGIPDEYWGFLKNLKNEGHHLLVLSNNNAIHYRDILEHYDMSCFDRIFLSHEIHSKKPERKIFEAVAQYLEEQGWQGNRTIYIDDIAENRQVGETFGWETAENIHFFKEKFA